MGAVSSGNTTEAVGPGGATHGTTPQMDAMQQPLAQKLQVVGCSPDGDSSLFAASPA